MGNEPEKQPKSSIWVGLKNQWHKNGEKQRKKKENRQKQVVNRPRGWVARKAGTAVFWVLFVFMLVVVFANIGSDDTAADVNSAQEEEETQNEATNQEAVQYAINFSRDYFNWSLADGGLDSRAERLGSYLAEGLDNQAGMQTEGLQWTSSVNSVQLEQIEEKGPNTAHITVQVKHSLNRTWTEEETRTETNDDDEEEEITEEVEKTEDKNATKYFVVPVAYENGTYGVYDLPQFTSVNKQTAVEVPEYEELDSFNGDESQVNEFLNTFFSTYAEEDPDRLSFMLIDGAEVQALQGTMNFQEITATSIYSNADGETVVFATVRFTDPATEMAFDTRYSVIVTEQEGRNMVKELNRY